MKKKILIGVGVVTLSLFLALVLTVKKEPKDARAGTVIRRVNVLGTSTSTPQNFNAHATSSATIVVGGQTDIVDLYFYPEFASSTAHVSFQVFASSHDRCGVSTAAGQGSYHDYLSTNTVSGNVTTINTATSTVSWNTPVQGKIYRLTNVNADCLKVFVGGTSVNLYVQAVLKTLSF